MLLKNAEREEKTPAKEPLAIYVHFGFCASKCPYCDFMSEKIPEDMDFSLWLEEYKKALDFYAPFTKGRRVQSVYFGGGTPSLLPAGFFEAILSYIQCNYFVEDNAEITMEGNPSSVTLAKLKAWKAAGINRFSLGVQAFDDEVLRFLGRRHNGKEALAALENTLKVFANASFDMIYAYPEHTAEKWRQQLAFALSFKAPHMSLYQLAIEPPSVFYKQGLEPIAEDKAANLYELTDEMMRVAGIPWYEISNYARKGAQSRHNLTYWRYGEYIGIGPSAHGRVRLKGGELYATEQVRAPFNWLKAKDKNAEVVLLTAEEKREEQVLMGLRTKEGVDLSLVNTIKAREYAEEGLLAFENGRVYPTLKGRLVLDTVIEGVTG
jgi:putative oxygen-independent coproporphyrinogen III oxidase